jgi:hypothetical protein
VPLQVGVLVWVLRVQNRWQQSGVHSVLVTLHKDPLKVDEHVPYLTRPGAALKQIPSHDDDVDRLFLRERRPDSA